jgi:hypothetical protein
MNVENISSQVPPPESRTMPPVSPQSVIELNEIKSILYLGIKGKLALAGFERHQVDTFA